MDTLLYFQSTATTSALRKLEGVSQAARERGWIVTRFDLHNPARIAKEIGAWNPLGCIVEFSADDVPLPRSALGRIPTVLLDCAPAFERRGVPTVCQHASQIGAFAADSLLAMGLASYAYVGWPERKFWDRMRLPSSWPSSARPRDSRCRSGSAATSRPETGRISGAAARAGNGRRGRKAPERARKGRPGAAR